MTYSQKLRDPRWQKKRLQILERDGWRCQSCGSTTKSLQVHHLIYQKKEPWEYLDECYQTLCDGCHSLRQKLTDRAVDILRMALRSVPSEDIIRVAESARSFSESIPTIVLGPVPPPAPDPAELTPDQVRSMFAQMRKALE